MLKPTPRRNGQQMVTIRTDFHATGLDLVYAIARECWRPVTQDGLDPDQRVSRVSAEEAVRNLFGEQGYGWLMDWADGFDDAEEVQASDWAHVQVARLWPGML